MRSIVLVATLLVALAAPRAADATIIIPKNLKELAAEAELVLVAEVTGQRADRVAGPESLIYTFSALRVLEQWKGAKTDRLEVAEVGGRVGDVTCFAAGMPQYKVGERVLVFLKKDVLGLWRTHGLVQRRFAVQKNVATGDDVVRLEKGLEHVTREHLAAAEVNAGGTVELETFAARARELIAQAARAQGEKR